MVSTSDTPLLSSPAAVGFATSLSLSEAAVCEGAPSPPTLRDDSSRLNRFSCKRMQPVGLGKELRLLKRTSTRESLTSDWACTRVVLTAFSHLCSSSGFLA